MTVSQPNPEVGEIGAEVDEFLDAPPPRAADDPPEKGSPTPHPGEPDVRDIEGVVGEPDQDEVREGTASPDVH
jgi:hypothetical protein